VRPRVSSKYHRRVRQRSGGKIDRIRSDIAAGLGDEYTDTRNNVGIISHCMKGDGALPVSSRRGEDHRDAGRGVARARRCRLSEVLSDLSSLLSCSPVSGHQFLMLTSIPAAERSTAVNIRIILSAIAIAAICTACTPQATTGTHSRSAQSWGLPLSSTPTAVADPPTAADLIISVIVTGGDQDQVGNFTIDKDGMATFDRETMISAPDGANLQAVVTSVLPGR
jgi:hypothetical protein